MKYFYDQSNDYSYALGMSISLDLIKYHLKDVIKVYISNKIKITENVLKFFNVLKLNNIIYEYNDEIFKDLSNKENCYVITKFYKFNTDLISKRHIVIDMNLDLGDIGTILRTMACFDFYDLVLIGNYDYFDLKTVRSSMGGIFLVNIKKYDDLSKYLSAYPDYQKYYFNQSGLRKYSKNLIIEKDYALIFTDKKNNQDLYFLNHKPLSISLVLASILYELK